MFIVAYVIFIYIVLTICIYKTKFKHFSHFCIRNIKVYYATGQGFCARSATASPTSTAYIVSTAYSALRTAISASLATYAAWVYFHL